MKKEAAVNIAASVRQRLLNLSRQSGEDFGLLLSRFAAERLLYRLSISPYRAAFLLKGAALFTVWEKIPRRPTRDVDFLGSGDASPEHLAMVFRSLSAIEVPEDGVLFNGNSVMVKPIREEQRYGGQRVRLDAHLAEARISLQIDIGFGDVVTPPAREALYPTLLPLPTPHLYLYPPETVIAEKWQAMIELGEGNSRLKDFYDVWVLSRHLKFDGPILAQAIQATFQRRQTPLPASKPVALQEQFCLDRAKVTQWKAFARKSRLNDVPELNEVTSDLQDFLWPPTESARDGLNLSMRWTPGVGWRDN